MQRVKLIHYVRRIVELGPRASCVVLKNRLQTQWFYRNWKRKALQKRANHTWEQIARKQRRETTFEQFFKHARRMCDAWFPTAMLASFAHDPDIIKKANRFVAKKFDLLGSGPTTFQNILWYEDFRLRNQQPDADCAFDKNCFYKDLVIQSGQTDQLIKDIKVPWELSRFYHAGVLGQAYLQKSDRKYVRAFQEQVADWIDQNPFMIGPNWVCPMEVGIRALNLLVGFYCFKDATTISFDFWQQFVCSLYDHFFYLEHNWELYDSRTSNHYLSDLVGYFALCCFFQSLPGVSAKKNWCYYEILREFDKQVFAQGADYEGSTAYHALVTELFYRFAQLCEQSEFCLPEKFTCNIAKMFDFIDWCTPCGGRLVTIGDNDSGKVLSGEAACPFVMDSTSSLRTGISSLLKKNENSPQRTKDSCCLNKRGLYGSKSVRGEPVESITNGPVINCFPEFGLSVFKSKKLHITLRHHVYNKRQPSGHFHNDAGSVTVAVDGVPIFIDPGSFVYTPSAQWRNRFRSVSLHNTIYLQGHEPVPFDDRLFALDLPDAQMQEQQESCISTFHDLYARFGVRICRTIFIDQEKKHFELTDWSETIPSSFKGSLPVCCWNFTLGPDVVATKDGRTWLLTVAGKPMLRMKPENIIFDSFPAWYSPAYGTKVSTTCLRACANTITGEKTRIVFQIYSASPSSFISSPSR